MALKDIIAGSFAPMGLNPTVQNDRLLLVSKINAAARELWEQTDLVGSMAEQTFTVSGSEKEISLPYYVDKVRGVRSVDLLNKVILHDMSPRYFYGEVYQSEFEFRIKNHSILRRTISNSAPMVISIPAVETTRIVFTVRGATTNAVRATEEVVIEVDELEVDLTKSFTDIVGFYKNRVTDNDCTLTDADDVVMSVIPNVLLEASYAVLQIVDVNLTSNQDGRSYEILYKRKFIPFVDDYDSFPVAGYDDAIVWKTLSHFFALKEGQEPLASGYSQQANKLVDDLDVNATRGVVLPVQSLPNRFINAMRPRTSYYGRA